MKNDKVIETLLLSIPATLSNLTAIRHFVHAALLPFCTDEDFLYETVLAVEEAVTNIILHGYKEEVGIITISIDFSEHFVEIVLKDTAPFFDPTTVPAPQLDVPLDDRQLGGLGVHIMRKYCDKIIHQRTESGMNELILLKRFPKR